MATSGVYPVFDNVFKIETAEGQMSTIADLETFSVSVDNNIEEWTPMTTEGWTRRLMTGKSVSISLNGKRNIGDVGNDYVAGLMWKTGKGAESTFEWDMPSGVSVTIPVVVNVSSAGGDSTNVDALEFEVQSNGKPTIGKVANA